MSFGGYATVTTLSGLGMLGTALAPAARARDRLVVAAAGAGMIAYAVYVSRQTSGVYVFPLQLIVLGFVLPVGVLGMAWLDGSRTHVAPAPAQGPGFPALLPDTARDDLFAPSPVTVRAVPGAALLTRPPVVPAASALLTCTRPGCTRAGARTVTPFCSACGGHNARVGSAAVTGSAACATPGCGSRGRATRHRFCGDCGRPTRAG